MTLVLTIFAIELCLRAVPLQAQDSLTPRPLDLGTTPPLVVEWTEGNETVDMEPSETEKAAEWETDRDSFTPSTKTAGRRRLILESAYSFIDQRRVKETHSFPEFLARYGLGDRFELRLGWNYEVGGEGSGISSSTSDDEFSPTGELIRESKISYGFKVGVTEQRRLIPESALIVAGFTPTSGDKTTTEFLGTYVFGWELPNRWKLDSALRFAADSEDGKRFQDWAPSIVLKAPIGEKWDAHVEYLGLFSSGKEQDRVAHYISPGLHYLLGENLEVGFRLGWGLNDQASRFFSNVGVGVRF